MKKDNINVVTLIILSSPGGRPAGMFPPNTHRLGAQQMASPELPTSKPQNIRIFPNSPHGLIIQTTELLTEHVFRAVHEPSLQPLITWSFPSRRRPEFPRRISPELFSPGGHSYPEKRARADIRAAGRN